MDDLWVRLGRLRGQTLHTARGLAFVVTSVDSSHVNDAVIVKPATSEIPRPIARRCFDEGEALGLGKRIRPVDLRNAKISEWNPAYVAAILRVIASDV